MDKSLSVVSYTLNLSIINYQTAILRKDFTTAEKLLPKIEEKDSNRIAHFLESQGYKKLALKITSDPDHKFELAIQLGELETAREIAEKDTESDHKWKQLSSLALSKWDFKLAELALWNSDDVTGLLLLYTSLGDAQGLEKLAKYSSQIGRHNVAFTSLFLLHRIGDCIDLLITGGRYPEAALFSRSYAPSELPRIVELWRKDLSRTNPTVAQALANPNEYPNLFPDYLKALEIQKETRPELNASIDTLKSASEYVLQQ
jgi:coatomer subunit beta'